MALVRAPARALMVLVNIVSAVPPAVWERELHPGLSAEFVHTHVPVEADWHVIYGLREKLSVPNAAGKVLFVASEPPEIREYSLRALDRYAAVLAPEFRYLKNLPQYVYGAGLAPWWVGVSSPGVEHYGGQEGPLVLTREALGKPQTPKSESISVIVSTKARTPLQVARLRLVDYLSEHLDSFEVFGVGHFPVDDKAAVLSQHRYHLAVENSAHRGYWTEKLADPILMGCFVFYGGHSSISEVFSQEGLRLIDPLYPEQVYREMCIALDRGLWSASEEGIAENRQLVLNHAGLHSQVLAAIGTLDNAIEAERSLRIPAHHPVSKWKKIVDPLYQRLGGGRN